MNNFADWHQEKSQIEWRSKRPHFRESDIFWCKLGLNIGFEQDGKKNFRRPVLILKKFNNESCLVVPLSKTSKTGIYYYEFCFTKNIKSKAVLSQIKLIDAKRLLQKIGKAKKDDFKEIRYKIKKMI